MNVAILTGNLGRDPDLRSTAKGEVVMNFPIGVQTGRSDNPSTMWVDCAIWGTRAESLQPYMVKGARVTVHGSIKTEEFTDKNGNARTKLCMKVSELDLPPRSESQQVQQVQQVQRPAPLVPSIAKTPFADMDDDLPF
jgi:single-strand DNA-binding protein